MRERNENDTDGVYWGNSWFSICAEKTRTHLVCVWVCRDEQLLPVLWRRDYNNKLPLSSASWLHFTPRLFLLVFVVVLSYYFSFSLLYFFFSYTSYTFSFYFSLPSLRFLHLKILNVISFLPFLSLYLYPSSISFVAISFPSLYSHSPFLFFLLSLLSFSVVSYFFMQGTIN